MTKEQFNAAAELCAPTLKAFAYRLGIHPTTAKRYRFEQAKIPRKLVQSIKAMVADVEAKAGRLHDELLREIQGYEGKKG